MHNLKWSAAALLAFACLPGCGKEDAASIQPAAEQSVELAQGAAAGRTVKPGDTFKDCEQCPEMVVIAAGKFTMGSAPADAGRSADEGPQHAVTFTKPFAVGKFEVTKGEYAAFGRATGFAPGAGCFFFDGNAMVADPGRSWAEPGFEQSERDPVVCVNWDETRAYLEWLTRQAGTEYRLLTEAEWEYVTRAGTTMARPWGNDIGRNNANCYGCGSEFDGKRTSPAGSFAANAFGVHDALGNVWERLEDCWHETYAAAPADGKAWTVGGACSQRVTRGGSWLSDAPDVRSGLRNWDLATNRKYTLGFRVARAL